MTRRELITRAAASAVLDMTGGVFLGCNVRTGNLFGVRANDRAVHMHVVGASGRGKSNFLEVLIRQDILQQDGVPRGVLVIDPHGGLVPSIVEWIANHRLYRHRTVRLIDPSDPELTFGFNPLLNAAGFEISALVDLVVNAIMQAWGGQDITQTPRLRTVLSELLYALATLGLTLLEATIFLRRDDPDGLRAHLVQQLPDEESRAFWEDLEGLSNTRRHEYLESVASRLRPFLRSPHVRRIFGQTERTLDLAAAMDRGEIILVNLKPGPHLSHEAARLIGTLLVADLYMACFRRRNVELPFYAYLDECQKLLTPDIARILDECRKFALRLILAHQHLGHLREAGEAIYRSVMANTLVKVVFGGLDPEDAEAMAKLVFRGHFDLQKPKARLIRPQAVGNERVWLAQESESDGTSLTLGSNWSRGGGVTENEATTTSRSTARGRNVTDSSSVTATGGESETKAGDDGDSSTTTSSSTAVTEGQAETISESETEGIAQTKGTARSRTWSVGGSAAAGVSHTSTRGRGEAYVTRYEDQPTAIWDLAEHVHIKGVSLAHLPVGQAYVRIGSKLPRRFLVPYVGAQFVLPERVARIRRLLLESTPYVVRGEQADAEHRAFRARLLSTVSRADEDGDVPLSIRATLE